jgi:NADH-quinone oxidoreductase subunit E
MKRYDLRNLKDDFYDRMIELIDQGLKVDEVGIFLFEVGDFSSIQKSADVIRASGNELMNSLKFNEVDWTIVVKKLSDTVRAERVEAFMATKVEEAVELVEEEKAE